jgi:hypothetical protein
MTLKDAFGLRARMMLLFLQLTWSFMVDQISVPEALYAFNDISIAY